MPQRPDYYPLVPKRELHYNFQLSDDVRQKKVEDILSPLSLTTEVIDRIRNVFLREMDLGLAKNPEQVSSLHMENTFIPELPNGTEEGEYCALDLGGTNFRVTWLHMEGGQEVTSKAKNFAVPESVMHGPGTELFEYLAVCIHKSLEEYGLLNKHLPLGFTFSFPMNQTALDVGILAKWTKNYKCPGVIGKDAVKMLNDAIHRRGDVSVDVVAILNDTTGILVQGAYLDHRTAIGVGIGTGANACYFEKVERVEKWEEHPNIKEVAIDTEFGAFGDNGVVDFLKTDIDKEVDDSSPLVKNYTFEKYISGKYLGEVVRCVLSKLVKQDLLFPKQDVHIFKKYNSFPTKLISRIEQDKNNSNNTRSVLDELGLLDIATDDDVAIVRHVCAVATIRAARLIAACLSCLLGRVDRDDVTIAMDGSMYKHHPKFHSLVTHFIQEILPSRKFRLMLAEDGSGKGAGLVAAIAERLKQNAR